MKNWLNWKFLNWIFVINSWLFCLNKISLQRARFFLYLYLNCLFPMYKNHATSNWFFSCYVLVRPENQTKYIWAASLAFKAFTITKRRCLYESWKETLPKIKTEDLSLLSVAYDWQLHINLNKGLRFTQDHHLLWRDKTANYARTCSALGRGYGRSNWAKSCKVPRAHWEETERALCQLSSKRLAILYQVFYYRRGKEDGH